MTTHNSHESTLPLQALLKKYATEAIETLCKTLDMQHALQDFYQGISLPQDVKESLDHPLYFPWIFFDWTPKEYKDYSLTYPLSLRYLEKHYLSIPPSERRFITSMLTTFFSYYLIQSIQDQQIIVQDLFLNKRYVVWDEIFIKHLKVGSIFYARLATLGTMTVIVGAGPCCIDPAFQAYLIQFKQTMFQRNSDPLTPRRMQEESHELRKLFLLVAQSIHENQIILS